MLQYFSKIDESIEISQKQWAVSLVRVGQHAEIVIEGLNQEGVYLLYICDFMARARSGYGMFGMFVLDEVYDAYVRIMLKSNCYQSSLKEMADDIWQHNIANPENRFPPLHIAEDFQSRAVDVQAAKALIKSIKEDQALALDGALKLNIYGKNIHRVFNQPHHNSTTWAVQQLEKNNIMHLTNKNICPSMLAANARDYTDQNDNRCIIS